MKKSRVKEMSGRSGGERWDDGVSGSDRRRRDDRGE